MLKIYFLLLLTIFYKVYQADAINTYGSQLITKEGVVDKSIFNNSNIAYFETNTSIILQPKRIHLPGINRIHLYKIHSLYYGSLRWESLSKSKVASYFGETIDSQVIYAEDNNAKSYYALHFDGNLTQIQVEFLFKYTDCKVTVNVENRPKILVPGYYTSEIYRQSVLSYQNFTCEFHIQSNDERYIVNMTSPYYYNHAYLTERLTLDGESFNSTRYNYIVRTKKDDSVLKYSNSYNTRYYKIGFIAHIKPVFGGLLIADDGSVKIRVNHTWYYLQYNSLTAYDAEAICMESGNATTKEVKSRIVRPNELLVSYEFKCTPFSRSLHYCSHIDFSRLHFIDYYHIQERVEQVFCEKTRPMRLNATEPEIKFFNKWHQVCYYNTDSAGALMICKGLGYSTLRSYTSQSIYYLTGDLVYNLQCEGKQNIKECLYKFSDTCRSKLILKCSNNLGLLKIVPGYHNKGLVQIGANSICSDSFTKTTADRVCRDLGFHDAINYWGNESSLPPIKMSCHDSHSSIEHCLYDFNAPCQSNQSVHIFCQNVRLVGGTEYEGRIELTYKNQVGLLCYDNFGILTAHTICKQLGFKKALVYFSGRPVVDRYGGYSNRYLLNNLVCQPDDIDINTCSYSNWTTNVCYGSYHATAVKCLGKGYCNNDTLPVNIGNYNKTNRFNVHSSIVNILPGGSNDWCTGVFIEEQWILTSASCFSMDSNVYRIFINRNLTTGNLTIYKYPSYNGHTGYDNLALVKVYHNQNVTPICMHNDIQHILNSINSSGWSESKFLGWTDFALYSRMTSLFSSAVCVSNTGLSSQRVANLFCGPNVVNPSNGFYGQSGGPLFGRYNNRDVLLGITNKAIKAARPFNNMIFTNIYKYKSWIDSKIKNN